MYTTNEFEQTAIQKGYEIERIYYSPKRIVLQATGYVVKDNRRLKINWNYLGKAFRSNGLCPEFDLEIIKDDPEV